MTKIFRCNFILLCLFIAYVVINNYMHVREVNGYKDTIVALQKALNSSEKLHEECLDKLDSLSAIVQELE